MEVLCYALTDLGYRNQFPNEDLFARPLSALSDSDSNFFSPSEILSVNPLTLNDYQKLLLDISGVRNAWLEKRVEKDGSAEGLKKFESLSDNADNGRANKSSLGN